MSKRTVAVVDYGMGNLRSVAQAVAHVAREVSTAGDEIEVVVTAKPEVVVAAERVVLPGQGAMRDCMRELRESGLQAAVLEAAASKPLLGVCIGMQMLLDVSEEGEGGTPGLGLIAGEVVRFRLDGRLQEDGSRFKVPQMGWNQVIQARFGAASRTRVTSISFTASTRARRTRATVPVKPITAAALPRRWPRVTFSRRSSTPRRAPPMAWRSTATSSTGHLDDDPGRRERRGPVRLSLRPSPTVLASAMLLIPAIDLKDGHCVRLRQGDMSDSTVFSDNPAAMARRWVEAGARRLHLVDLNGAFAGKPVNEAAVKAILAEVGDEIPVQLGGGIRDLDTIERYLDDGLSYIIIGTAAVKNPGFMRDACSAFGGHIIVGLDAKDGKVATDGWSKLTGHEVADLAKKFEDYGVEGIVYTDIGRDGMLSGVNIDATVKLAQVLTIPVFASGGLSSLADIEKLCAVEEVGIEGVICGRAIYSGELDFASAQARADELAV